MRHAAAFAPKVSTPRFAIFALDLAHGRAEDTLWTSDCTTVRRMMSVWLVTTGFVIATFLIVKVRRYKKMPRALLDAIAADAIFGALLLLRALL
jgi:hypothetical protein